MHVVNIIIFKTCALNLENTIGDDYGKINHQNHNNYMKEKHHIRCLDIPLKHITIELV